MVACGALRVTWLSGLMESGRPIKFSSTLFITGGEEAEGFVWWEEEAEGFVWWEEEAEAFVWGGGVPREDLSLPTECKGGTIEHWLPIKFQSGGGVGNHWNFK